MSVLRAVRARIVVARAIERAVRWALYASLLACACLTASKFLPVAPALALVAALLPLAAALRVRRVTILETALMIDGAFRLDERVSSAADLRDAGPMADALRADAARALASVDARSVGRVRWPRETKLVVLGVALVLALAIVPSPRASGATALSPELEAASNKLRDAAKDPLVAEHARELERIAELLKREEIRDAFVAIEALQSKVADRLADRSLAPETRRALEELADRAAGAGAGLARAMEEAGIEVAPMASSGAAKRLERAAAAVASERPETWDASKLAAGAPVALNTRPAVENALRERRWDARYEEIVRRYYEEKP